MSNLHRDLAPISSAAWAEIEEEARRSFSRRAAARRVVDVPDPAGYSLSAIGTGHLDPITSLVDGVETGRREVYPVFELRVPFSVTRQAVDDVDRGSQDSDWQPVIDAATLMATAEDRTVFHGGEGLAGIGPSSSNATIALPSETRDLPGAVAQAINCLRLASVAGSYSLLLSADLYTKVTETTDHGYPVLDHIARIMGSEGRIVWAPAIDGALVVSERGGDYELQLGQDLSIGYLSHDAEKISLYLQETFAFRVNTPEAAVVIGDK